MKQMYKGKINSPESYLKAKLVAESTIIYIADNSILPELPNLLTIGEGEKAETVLVKNARSDGGYDVQRGIEGAPKVWEKTTVVARNFCNLDYQTLIDNIGELEKNKADKTEIKTKLSELTDDETHRLVTDTEKKSWSDKAEKTDIKTKLSDMEDDITHRLVTDEEKEKWNKVTDKADKTELEEIEKKIEGISPYKYIKLEINCAYTTTVTIKKDNSVVKTEKFNNETKIIDIEEYGNYEILATIGQRQYKQTLQMNDAKIYKITINLNDDKTNAPGEKVLKAGTMQQGYFGVVTNGLPSGTELASKCGITAGTAQYSNEGYLKFAYKGKILFKSKKPFRHSISWDDINNKNCVFGKTIEHNGVKYKVRLMQGHDPNRTEKNSDGYYEYNGRNCYHSEWNMLMLPIHIQAKDYSWREKNNVYNSEIPQDWNINFTDQDILTHRDYGSGSYQWCQETARMSACRLSRGYYGVSNVFSYSSSDSSSYMGWSPVLEVIE